MSLPSLGDLSQSYSMRQRNVSLRQEISKLTDELASGQVSDVRDILNGNYSYLTDITKRMDLLEGYQVATAEAGIFTDALQRTLGLIDDTGRDMSASLLTAGTSAIGVSGSDTVAEAENALDTMIGALNTKSAGRYLFSGTAVDQPPLLDSATLRTALRTAVAGATTPDDVLTAARNWFVDPAGFEAILYQGGAALAPFGLSPVDQVTLDLRATDPKLREVLMLTAVSTLADDPTFNFDVATQSELFGKAGQALLIAGDEVIALRAEVGFVEARIEKITARNAAEVTSMEFAKQALLAVDPYEAATKLEEAQFQLQSLYSVTVRMSQLSLVNFL